MIVNTIGFEAAPETEDDSPSLCGSEMNISRNTQQMWSIDSPTPIFISGKVSILCPLTMTKEITPHCVECLCRICEGLMETLDVHPNTKVFPLR